MQKKVSNAVVAFNMFVAVVAVVATLFLTASCKGQSGTLTAEGDAVAIDHAQLLRIEHCEGYSLVTVLDPWKVEKTDATQRPILHQYALVKRGDEVPASIPQEATVVRVPLQKMCISTSVHTNLLMELGATKAIASVCDMNYIIAPNILNDIKANGIADAGSSMNPNVEKIVQLGTDAILMSPFEGASYGLLEKTNIPIIECADYMETSALGRAEWMKFYGMLVGMDVEAEARYDAVAQKYMSLKASVAQTASSPRPKLLVDMLNGQTWYMPGGRSTYGALYADACADYSIGDSTLSGTQSLSLEKVMAEALDADVWVIKYGQSDDLTLQSLGQQNAAYSKFAAYERGCVYGCNTMKVPFYDEAPFHPEYLLADIIKILYPNSLPEHELRYFKKLK